MNWRDISRDYIENEKTKDLCSREVMVEKYIVVIETQWTKNCIICFDENITHYRGHVHKESVHILAGFCSKHSIYTNYDRTQKEQCQGCFGKYIKEMGIKKG